MCHRKSFIDFPCVCAMRAWVQHSIAMCYENYSWIPLIIHSIKPREWKISMQTRTYANWPDRDNVQKYTYAYCLHTPNEWRGFSMVFEWEYLRNTNLFSACRAVPCGAVSFHAIPYFHLVIYRNSILSVDDMSGGGDEVRREWSSERKRFETIKCTAAFPVPHHRLTKAPSSNQVHGLIAAALRERSRSQ